MAVAFRVSTTSYAATPGTTTTTSALSGAVAGDMLILHINTPGTTISTPGAGWTLLRSISYGGQQHYIYYRTTVDPGTTFTFAASCVYQKFYAAFSSCSGIQVDQQTTGVTGGFGSVGQFTVSGPTSTTKNTMSYLALGVYVGLGNTVVSGYTLLGGDYQTGSTWYRSIPNAVAGALGGVSVTFTNAGQKQALADYVVLTPANVAPLAAYLTTPSAYSYQDLAAGFTFAWGFNTGTGPQDDTQTSYSFRRRTGVAAYEYWNVGTAAWQAGEVFNASTVSSLTFAAAKWTTGTPYVWSVNTIASNALTGTYAADQIVTANDPVVVTLSGPVGTVTATNRPAVTWTFSGGTAQSLTRTLIYPLATTQIAGFTPLQGTGAVSDVSLGGAGLTSNPAIDLVNGTTYVAYVQATEVGGQSTTSVGAQFNISIDVPAVPTFTSGGTTAVNTFTLQGRDNMLTLNQSSLETDLTGWVVQTNCTIARSTAQFLNGSASLALTASAAANMGATTAVGLGGTPVLPGVSYTALASYRAATTARSTWILVNWYDSSGTNISTTAGPTPADTTTGWVQASFASTSPAGAAFASVIVQILSPAIGEVHYVDAISIAPGASTTWTRGGLVGLTIGSLERSLDNVNWTALTAGLSGGALFGATQTANFSDQQFPLGVLVYYRIRVSATPSAGFTISNVSAATSFPSTLTSSAWFLSDGTNAPLAVRIRNSPTVHRAVSGGGVRVLGRANDVVITDAVGGLRINLTFLSLTLATWQALDALLVQQVTLTLRSITLGVLQVRVAADLEHQIATMTASTATYDTPVTLWVVA